MTRYRADAIDDLMSQVRSHWEHLERTYDDPGSRPADGFSRAPDRVPTLNQPSRAPAHPPVDVARAYDYNLVASQYATVEAFGRKRRRAPVIQSSASARGEGPAIQQRLPPQTAFGQAGLPAPSRRAADTLPRWVKQEMAYEEAIRLIEERGLAAARAPTRAGAPPSHASDAAAPAPAPSPTRDPRDGFELADGRPPRRGIDVTDPGFAYRPGESAWEQLAAGAKVVSGQGAEFVDPERTQTFFGRPAT